MKKLALTLGVAVFLFSPLWAFADTTVTIDTNSTTTTNGFGYSAGDGAGQSGFSFTAPLTGTVSSITTVINKIGSPVDNAIVGLQADSSGSPSNTFLGSGTVTGSTLQSYPTCSTQYTITLDTPVDVVSGTTYWVVYTRSGSLSTSNRYSSCGSGNASSAGKWTLGTSPTVWDQTVSSLTWSTFTIVGGATPSVNSATSTVDKTLDITYDGVILYCIGFWGIIWFFRKKR